MKAIVYVSLTGNSRTIAADFEGEVFEIKTNMRIPKTMFGKLLRFGYLSVFNKYQTVTCEGFDQNKFDEITLIAPVHAGKTCILMRSFLKDFKMVGKIIRLVLTSGGEKQANYDTFTEYIDSSNNIIEKVMYKDTKMIRSGN